MFRPREKERYKLRKHRKNDMDSFRKLQQVKKDFEKVKAKRSLASFSWFRGPSISTIGCLRAVSQRLPTTRYRRPAPCRLVRYTITFSCRVSSFLFSVGRSVVRVNELPTIYAAYVRGKRVHLVSVRPLNPSGSGSRGFRRVVIFVGVNSPCATNRDE